MYQVPHKIIPNHIQSLKCILDTKNNNFIFTIFEYTGYFSRCRANPDLVTMRCNKHILKYPFNPELLQSYQSQQNYLNFFLTEILNGKAISYSGKQYNTSYEPDDNKENNFFSSVCRHSWTPEPLPRNQVKQIEHSFLNRNISHLRNCHLSIR